MSEKYVFIHDKNIKWIEGQENCRLYFNGIPLGDTLGIS